MSLTKVLECLDPTARIVMSLDRAKTRECTDSSSLLDCRDSRNCSSAIAVPVVERVAERRRRPGPPLRMRGLEWTSYLYCDNQLRLVRQSIDDISTAEDSKRMEDVGLWCWCWCWCRW